MEEEITCITITAPNTIHGAKESLKIGLWVDTISHIPKCALRCDIGYSILYTALQLLAILLFYQSCQIVLSNSITTHSTATISYSAIMAIYPASSITAILLLSYEFSIDLLHIRVALLFCYFCAISYFTIYLVMRV